MAVPLLHEHYQRRISSTAFFQAMATVGIATMFARSCQRDEMETGACWEGLEVGHGDRHSKPCFRQDGDRYWYHPKLLAAEEWFLAH